MVHFTAHLIGALAYSLPAGVVDARDNLVYNSRGNSYFAIFCTRLRVRSGTLSERVHTGRLRFENKSVDEGALKRAVVGGPAAIKRDFSGAKFYSDLNFPVDDFVCVDAA